jgi:hypothetical protein
MQQAGEYRVPAILHTYPRRAGDGFQRPLIPRSRFQPRLTPSVRPHERAFYRNFETGEQAE